MRCRLGKERVVKVVTVRRHHDVPSPANVCHDF
ncbi:Uncharacterised protein [Vibrio cholerae]|nr:Uncharacterised protein [Vibrio cholerae]